MFHELTQIDDRGQLFLSGSIEDWQPVHDRGVTVVVDLEGDVDHGVPTAADAFLSSTCRSTTATCRTSSACTRSVASPPNSSARAIAC